jgi:hypothetical protein
MRVVGSDKVIDKGLSDSIGGPLREGSSSSEDSSLRFELDNGGPEEWGEHAFGGAKAADRMLPGVNCGEIYRGGADDGPTGAAKTPKTERYGTTKSVQTGYRSL